MKPAPIWRHLGIEIKNGPRGLVSWRFHIIAASQSGFPLAESFLLTPQMVVLSPCLSVLMYLSVALRANALKIVHVIGQTLAIGRRQAAFYLNPVMHH